MHALSIGVADGPAGQAVAGPIISAAAIWVIRTAIFSILSYINSYSNCAYNVLHVPARNSRWGAGPGNEATYNSNSCYTWSTVPHVDLCLPDRVCNHCYAYAITQWVICAHSNTCAVSICHCARSTTCFTTEALEMKRSSRPGSGLYISLILYIT